MTEIAPGTSAVSRIIQEISRESRERDLEAFVYYSGELYNLRNRVQQGSGIARCTLQSTFAEFWNLIPYLVGAMTFRQMSDVFHQNLDRITRLAQVDGYNSPSAIISPVDVYPCSRVSRFLAVEFGVTVRGAMDIDSRPPIHFNILIQIDPARYSSLSSRHFASEEASAIYRTIFREATRVYGEHIAHLSMTNYTVEEYREIGDILSTMDGTYLNADPFLDVDVLDVAVHRENRDEVRRAEKLLLEVLPTDLANEYRSYKRITVFGEATGTKYVLTYKSQINVEEWGDDRPTRLLCVVSTTPVPIPDLLLSQYLMLTTNEREFVAMAIPYPFRQLSEHRQVRGVMIDEEYPRLRIVRDMYGEAQLQEVGGCSYTAPSPI